MRGTFLALGLVAACGTDDGTDPDEVDCAKETGTDIFVVGLQKAGVSGVLDFKMMSAEPAPPARGDNKWVFQINLVAGGAPMESAQLTVTPFMPLHQHGSPLEVTVEPMGTAGQYELKPVNLWMPGVWETTIRATSGGVGSTSDRVVYRFCVN